MIQFSEMTSPIEKALIISRNSFFIRKNVIATKSFSINYIFYRIVRPILKLNYKLFKLLNPTTPWTSQASIRIFKKILNKDMIGLEYGSGNSTIFFSKYLKKVVSIEHDSAWFEIVKSKLTTHSIQNVEYYFIPKKDQTLNFHYSFFQDYNLKNDEFEIRKEYHDYFSEVLKYPDEYFDFIIIDGRARVECCLNSIPKLRTGGIFVLDNSDRERYKPVFKVLQHWQSINTTTGLFDTTLWFKPKA